LGDIKKIVVGINGGDVGGPFPKVARPKNSIGTSGSAKRRRSTISRIAAISISAGGTSIRRASSTDWGAHHVDIATWAIREDKKGMGPVEIDGTDAKHPVPFKDGYPYRGRLCYKHGPRFRHQVQIQPAASEMTSTAAARRRPLEGAKGRIFVSRGKIAGKPIEQKWTRQVRPDDLVRPLYKGKPSESHTANFSFPLRPRGGADRLRPVQSRQAMNTCHLCAIAGGWANDQKWDPKAEKSQADDQAAAFFARTPRQGLKFPGVRRV